VLSTYGDSDQGIRARKFQSWRHHNVQYPLLSGRMPSSTMEVSCYRQREIGCIALMVHPPNVIRLIVGCLPQYAYTYIELLAAGYSYCFQFYGRFLNGHPGSCFCWLHRQHRSGLAGVCVVAVCQSVTYSMYHPPIGLISILSLLAGVIVSPWYGGVE